MMTGVELAGQCGIAHNHWRVYVIDEIRGEIRLDLADDGFIGVQQIHKGLLQGGKRLFEADVRIVECLALFAYSRSNH